MRVSVSDLDLFRWYESSEEMTLDDFLAMLRRETPPTPAMLAGRALHKYLETATENESITVESDGYKFAFACDVALSLPRVRELKGEIELQTSAGPVTLVGVVDGMDGEICDYKLSGYFDAEKYLASYQWRCYLMMFGGMKFVYRVFVGKPDDEFFPSAWTIREYHELPLYRYADIENDVKREVERFAVFLTQYQAKAA